MSPDWDHQRFAVDQSLQLQAAGVRRLLVSIPTGGGKTRVAERLIEAWSAKGLKTILFTNRTLLLEQTSRALSQAGIDHGIRAAGYTDTTPWPVQLAMIQTEESKVYKRKEWQPFQWDRCIVDEAHVNKAGVMQKILGEGAERGAMYLGLTATPVDLLALYDRLLVAGSVSSLRACGALVPCMHFACDEPDMRGIKPKPGEDLTENQARKAIMRNGIGGRVIDWFNRLDPERRPSILFAPGVAESLWFAEQFVAAGITAAHIDGENIWINGELHRNSEAMRRQLMGGSRNGSITVLCNRFVLREGIDAPWLSHGILATVFGSLSTYLQSGGRLLRAHPGLEAVTLQDHGGHWHRLGSLNADRDWKLEYTNAIAQGLREDRLRNKKCTACGEGLEGLPNCPHCGTLNEVEPTRCPKCGQILNRPRCPCGYEVNPALKSRPVVQSDGTLREMKGDVYKPHRICKRPDGPKIWERMYHRSKTEKGARTFRAAEAMFAMENNWGYPDRGWPLMPTNELDFFRLVAEVPFETLIQKG